MNVVADIAWYIMPFLVVAIILIFLRLVQGPSLPDRVVALDVHNLAAFQNAFRCRTEHVLYVIHEARLADRLGKIVEGTAAFRLDQGIEMWVAGNDDDLRHIPHAFTGWRCR